MNFCNNSEKNRTTRLDGSDSNKAWFSVVSDQDLVRQNCFGKTTNCVKNVLSFYFAYVCLILYGMNYCYAR